MKNTTCKNCTQTIHDSDSYCPACGQKISTKRIRFSTLIADFLQSSFGLDGQLFKTFKYLFIPARLTKMYFEGKHASVYSPMRVFLVASLLFFTLSLPVMPFYKSILNFDLLQGRDTLERMEIKSTIDSVIIAEKTLEYEGLSTTTIDSLKNHIYAATFEDKIIIDSLSIVGDRRLKVSDINELSREDFLDKYFKEKSSLTQYFAYQMVKIVQDPMRLERFVVGKLALSFVLMFPFLALFLSIIYLRKKYFYVEHFVFTIHVQSTVFLLFTLANILYLLTFTPQIYVGALVLSAIFLFMAFHSYYKQSLFKTTIKFCLSTLAYAIIWSISIAMMFLIGIALV